MAQQTLDFVIAQQVTGQAEIAKLIKSVGALDAEMKKLRAATAGIEGGFNKASGAIRGGTNVLDAQSKALRNHRQGFQMAGMQVNDFATSVSTGASPVMAFNQQIGQLGFAMSMMGGKTATVGRFLAGPWSIAVIGAAMVLGPMIENLLGVGKASESSTKSISNLVEAKRKSFIESQNAAKAQDVFARTLDGVREAAFNAEKAMRALENRQQSQSEQTLSNIKASIANAKAINTESLALLNAAEAQNKRREGGLAAADPRFRSQFFVPDSNLDALRKDIEDSKKELNNLLPLLRTAQADVSVERGRESVEDRINRRFDAQVDGARRAAIANNEVGDSLRRNVEDIEAARDAELDRHNESEKARRGAARLESQRERARKREAEQLESLTEKLKDYALTHLSGSKEIGETAKKLSDFNKVVEAIRGLSGGQAVLAEYKEQIVGIRNAIEDEGANAALEKLNAEIDKLTAKDLSPFEQSIKGIADALSDPELRLPPLEVFDKAQEARLGAARSIFEAAQKEQQNLLDKAMGVDNAFAMQVQTLQQVIASMKELNLPTGEFEARLQSIKDIAEETNLVEQNNEIQRSYEAIAQAISNSFVDMITGAQSFENAMRRVIQSVIDELFRLFVVQQIVGMVKGVLGGAFGGGATTPSDLAADFDATFPGRALGGSVGQNQPYMVGERGPELFMPGRSGTVIPTQNSRTGGGGSTINVSVDARGATSPEMVRQQVQQGILEAAPSIVAAAQQRTINTLRRPRLAGAL